jgi:3-methyladenine DNA glycosylase AlkD
MNDLTANLDKIHTTALGIIRIKKNLNLETGDVVAWCRKQTKNADDIVRKGKNWYVHTGNSVITINAHSYTIITAHALPYSSRTN